MRLTPSEIMASEDAHTSGLYGKQPIIFVSGKGASLFDIDGQEYLDCSSGHGVANLGHGHPAVAAAIAEQSTRLITSIRDFLQRSACRADGEDHQPGARLGPRIFL